MYVVGAIILSTDGELSLDVDQYGDILVIGTVALVSLTYAPAARLANALGPLRVNTVVNLTGGIIALPLALATAPAPLLELPSAGWKSLFIALMLFQVFGLTLWYVAMRNVTGWIVSALRATGPVIAAPVAYLAFGQVLSQLQLLGAVLVLVTSALIAKEQRR